MATLILQLASYYKSMIIIPDIHGRDFWVKPVEKNLGKEHIVFLGDYLDPYDYEGIPSSEVFPRFEYIIAMKKKNPDDITLLLGNHDLHYLNGDLLGGRYDYANGYRNSQAFSDNSNLFQLAYEAEVAGRKYLFTHAGVLRGWIDKNRQYLGRTEPEQISSVLNDYWGNRGYWPRLFTILADIPYSRWGNSRFGSPVWADIKDWSDDAFELSEIYQIFGHSQQESGPVIGEHFACLDCRKAYRLDDKGVILPYCE